MYVWSYSGGALTTVGTGPLTASDAGNEDGLGWSVAMPSDSLIYAGAPYHPGNDGPGAVYGFSSETSIEVGYTPWAHVSQTELSASGSSLFGFSVAAGGGVVAAGAPDTGSNEGAVYLFEPAFGCATQLIHGCFRSSSYTTPSATLTDPSGNGQLGHSVALTGDGGRVLAGAPGEPVPPHAPAGAAYVFQAPSGGWADATIPARDAWGRRTARPTTASARRSRCRPTAVRWRSATRSGQRGSGEADVFEAQTGDRAQLPAGRGRRRAADDLHGHGHRPRHRRGDADGHASASAPTPREASAAAELHAAASRRRHELLPGDLHPERRRARARTRSPRRTRATTSTPPATPPRRSVAIDRRDDEHLDVVQPRAGGGRSEHELHGDRDRRRCQRRSPDRQGHACRATDPGTFNPGGCTLSGGSGTTASCTFSYTPSQVGPGTHQLTAGLRRRRRPRRQPGLGPARGRRGRDRRRR